MIDTLPAGIAYAPGTGRVDGRPIEPVQTGQALRWAFPELDTKPHTIAFASVLLPGAAEGSLVTNVASIEAAVPNAPGLTASASAQAAVRVIAGLYSVVHDDRRARLSRYAQVRAGSMRGDSGLPDVRIFLESGESVTTDRNGRFSFACVRGGMHVARLDTATLPAGAAPVCRAALR